MPHLGTMPSFSDSTTMVSSDVDSIFIDTINEDSIFNVIHEIDSDNLDAAADLPESLFQFFPFNDPAHRHAGTRDTGDGLDTDSIRTEQINLDQSTLVYTGQPKVVMQTGVLSAFNINGNSLGTAVTADVTTNGAGITWDLIPTNAPVVNQNPVVILTGEDNTRMGVTLWTEHISSTQFYIQGWNHKSGAITFDVHIMVLYVRQ